MLRFLTTLNVLVWLAWLGFMIASLFEWSVSTEKLAKTYETLDHALFFFVFICFATAALVSLMAKLGSSALPLAGYWRALFVAMLLLTIAIVPLSVIIPKEGIGHAQNGDILLKERGEWVTVSTEMARGVIRMNLRRQAIDMVLWWNICVAGVAFSLTSKARRRTQ